MNKPLMNIPNNLLKDFTLDGKIGVWNYYRDDTQDSEVYLEYNREQINLLMIKAKNKETGGYGDTDTFLYNLLEKYSIDKKTVAIMGSVSPWYESICLEFGGSPTTIEYNKIISKDNRLKTITVKEYDKNPICFDCAISISSFEHDGLGRYGDPIDPYGDIKAMKKMKKTIKKDGLLFLAVPFGKDQLLWNLHRVYGRIRFPMLTDGWEIIDSCGFEEKHYDLDGNTYHPVFVLKNI